MRCTKDPECGVAGTFVCWEAGAYVVVGRNAAASANTRGTAGGEIQAMHGRSRQGEEDPRGRQQGEVFGAMGELCSGSDVQQMTFRTSTVEHRFRRCAKLLDLESFIHQGTLQLQIRRQYDAHTRPPTERGDLRALRNEPTKIKFT